VTVCFLPGDHQHIIRLIIFLACALICWHFMDIAAGSELTGGFSGIDLGSLAVGGKPIAFLSDASHHSC
jgi:hypothetical protein